MLSSCSLRITWSLKLVKICNKSSRSVEAPRRCRLVQHRQIWRVKVSHLSCKMNQHRFTTSCITTSKEQHRHSKDSDKRVRSAELSASSNSSSIWHLLNPPDGTSFRAHALRSFARLCLICTTLVSLRRVKWETQDRSPSSALISSCSRSYIASVRAKWHRPRQMPNRHPLSTSSSLSSLKRTLKCMLTQIASCTEPY